MPAVAAAPVDLAAFRTGGTGVHSEAKGHACAARRVALKRALVPLRQGTQYAKHDVRYARRGVLFRLGKWWAMPMIDADPCRPDSPETVA
jgi:hypothetical protein